MLFPRLIGRFFKELSYVPFFSFYSFPSSVHQPLIGPKTFSDSRRPLSGGRQRVLSCRKISRCKWLVTDPPQCQANLRAHFPDPLHFTSERCDARASHRERSAPRDGSGDHTRYARCAAYMRFLRSQFRSRTFDRSVRQRNCPSYINIDSIVNHNYMKN